MKRPLILPLLIVAWGAHAERDCAPIGKGDPAYAAVVARLGTLGGRAPGRIDFCGDGWSYWKADWGVVESGKNWSKTGRGRCTGKSEGDSLQPDKCASWILFTGATFDGEIKLAHDLDITLIEQLIAAARQVIAYQDRILSIRYTPVRDGGAWSDTEHGYLVDTARSPDYGSGEILRIVSVCDGSGCRFQASTASRWAT